MAWTDNLRKGKFRGIEFFTQSSQAVAGRRAVQHQFPNRETPYSEDMGRAAKSWTIEGHVLGDDYFQTRDLLIEAFDKRGPTELIHPYYGSLFVQVSEVNITESTLEGAIAVFTAKFLEAGSNRFPKGINDKASLLEKESALAVSNAKKEFDNNFTIASLPSFAVDSARALVKKAQEIFDSTTKGLSDNAEAVAELAFSTRNLVAETNDLLQSPSDLSQRLLDSYQLMEDAINNAKFKTDAYKNFYNFKGDQEELETTPIRTQEKRNANQFENFMRRVAAVKSSNTAIAADYASFNEAESARVLITETIEEQLREIEETDGELWQSLYDVNAQLVEALPDIDADLPSLKEIEAKSDTCSLIIAYDLFERQENEEDIINRNNIRNPSFIPKGKVLEVIE